MKERTLATERAKSHAKRALGPLCECAMCPTYMSFEVLVDGAHVFNEGQYRDLNSWLIE